MEKRELSYTVGGNENWYSHYGKQYGIPQKTKNRVAIWSSNSTPRHLSEKTLIWNDTFTLMFRVALFTIAEIQKQPKCPLTDEWIKMSTHTHTHMRMCAHTHNGILFSHKKWNLQQHEWTQRSTRLDKSERERQIAT